MKEWLSAILSFTGVVFFWMTLSSLSSIHLGISSASIQKGGKSSFILAWTHSFLDPRLRKE